MVDVRAPSMPYVVLELSAHSSALRCQQTNFPKFIRAHAEVLKAAAAFFNNALVEELAGCRGGCRSSEHAWNFDQPEEMQHVRAPQLLAFRFRWVAYAAEREFLGTVRVTIVVKPLPADITIKTLRNAMKLSQLFPEIPSTLSALKRAWGEKLGGHRWPLRGNTCVCRVATAEVYGQVFTIPRIIPFSLTRDLSLAAPATRTLYGGHGPLQFVDLGGDCWPLPDWMQITPYGWVDALRGRYARLAREEGATGAQLKHCHLLDRGFTFVNVDVSSHSVEAVTTEDLLTSPGPPTVMLVWDDIEPEEGETNASKRAREE